MTTSDSEITLPIKWKRIYLFSRFFLYLCFILISLFVAYRILFPEISLDFSFSNTKSLKNTLVSAHTNLQKNLKNGIFNNGETLFFDANPLGNFEDTNFKLVTNKNSTTLGKTTVKVRKSYAAFFYPTGEPLGFADGSLLSANGTYYIVSDGKARQFISGSALDQLGFSRSSFLMISQNELALNPRGDDILDANSYPDNTLVVIGNQYYQFKNQQLLPFVSDRAFLSKYEPTQAIPKNEDFLNSHQVSESFIGFADGTLASSDQSVFVLSQGKSYPIADSVTFTAMGYNWDDVIPLTPGEINTYERQKQFTINQPHPDGTFFYDKDQDKYFLIENNKKRPVEDQLTIKTRLKNSPILVNSQSLEKNITCIPIKNRLSFSTFSCQLSLLEINNFLGNDYQFEISFENEADLAFVNVVFYTQLNQTNIRNSLSTIKARLQNNYLKN